MVDDTGLILTIFTYFISLTVILGLVGGSFVGKEIDTPDGEPSVLGITDNISLFFQGLSYSLTGVPLWVNLLLFSPVIITLFYIIVKVIIDLIPG